MLISQVCEQLIPSNKPFIRKEMFFRLIELANSAESVERNGIFLIVDTFMETLSKADTALYAELSSDIQKDLNRELNRMKSGVSNRDTDNVQAYDQVLQQWIKQTMDNANRNGTAMMDYQSTGGATTRQLDNHARPHGQKHHPIPISVAWYYATTAVSISTGN